MIISKEDNIKTELIVNELQVLEKLAKCNIEDELFLKVHGQIWFELWREIYIMLANTILMYTKHRNGDKTSP